MQEDVVVVLGRPRRRDRPAREFNDSERGPLKLRIEAVLLSAIVSDAELPRHNILVRQTVELAQERVILGMGTPPYIRITYTAVQRSEWKDSVLDSAFHRSVRSPCPSPGFTPMDHAIQGQRELPVGCRTATRHEATAPLLQSPCGAPFGPSVRGGAARPICYPAFRPWGASLASSASNLLRPLRISADRSDRGPPGLSPLLRTVGSSPRVRPRTFGA